MQTQQMDLYKAERLVPEGRRFDTLEEIQVFVDALRETEWYERQYLTLVQRIEVGPARNGGRNGSVGWYESRNAAGRIEMAPVHWNERTICHEVSHVLAEALHGSESHDPWFARIYLELVHHVLGPAAFVELLHAFNDYGINHDPEQERD